jgi:tetratricopeptide (TPR) repeat protein
MKFNKILTSTLLSLSLSTSLLAADFGDHSSSTLTTNAWNALAANNTDDALLIIDKCIELYASKAKEMQASLSGFVNGNDASQYWALNDVGTCLFIKGETLQKKGDIPGAIKAYKRLVNEFKFAQTWDTKGWFWKPSDAAKQKIVELSMDL